MPTLREQIEELKKLKRKLAIWEAIHHLIDDKFVSKDGRKVSGIKVPNTDELIPEEEIEDVLQKIAEEDIKALQDQIAEIENRQVVLTKDENDN